MMRSFSLFVLGLALGLSSCKGSAPVQDADAGGAAPAPASDDATEPAAASGCSDDSDCDGGVCEGEGCGPGEGVCQPRDRMCTRDLQPYCGCDGQTFRNSGSCPGARFAHRGECEAAAP
jgi:hypothetical protein